MSSLISVYLLNKFEHEPSQKNDSAQFMHKPAGSIESEQGMYD
jgi:hypothetical protein